jgi:hypothetical protein
MKLTKIWLLLVASVFVCNCSFAARFWVAAGAGNWSNTANWSTVSGGAGGSSVPGVGDDVTFDNNGLGPCTIDVPVSVKSITVSALYTQTITQGANAISTVNAATFSGGVFTGGTANITIAGVFTLSGTAFTSTSAVLELDKSSAFTSGSFSHNNGTVLFNGAANQTFTISFATSPVFYTLQFAGNGFTYTITSGVDITVVNALNFTGTQSYTLNTGIIDVQGDINSSNTSTGCGGSAQININGAGVQNFNGNATTAGVGALPLLTINKASGTLNLSGFPSVANNFTYTAGTVSAGTSTFCFTRGSVNNYSINGSITLNNISFVLTNVVTATIAVGTTLTAAGNLTIAGAGNAILNTGNINVDGNILLTNTATGGGGSATINIVGSGAQTIDGTAIIANESRLPIININNPGGTLSLAGNISFSANVTYTAGTISPGASTCYIVNNLTMTGNFSLGNLTVSAAGNTTVTVAAGNTVTATGTLDLENGANLININTGTIAVQGNLIDNNTSVTGGGTGTILIDGTGAQNITSTGVIDQGRLPAVTINSTGGTVTLPSLITVTGNWTYTGGTLDVTTNNSTVVFEGTLSITGSHTLNNVTFDGSNNFTFTTAVGTTLTISGTMTTIGTGNITLTTGTLNLNGNLSLTNTGAGGGTTVIAFVSAVNQSIFSSLPVNESCLPAVTINKSGGTLSFPALITVKGNWVYTAGTLDVTTNNSTVVFASPLGTGTFGITGSHTLNNVTFLGNNNNTATVSTGTILTVTGTLSTAGTFNVVINTPVAGTTAIQAQGNITVNNTSPGGGGTGLILINGTGNQAFTSTAAASQGLLPFITIQKASGTLTLTGIFSESRSWTYTSGTVDATTNASTVVFGGNNLTITSAGMSFYNVTTSANTSTLASSMTVNNNLTIGGLSVLSPVANTINLSGNWSDWGTAGFAEATSTVNFIGSGLQTITTPGGENFANLTVNNTGAGIQLENNTTIATTLTMTQGNIDLNGGNVLTLGLSVINNGTLVNSAGAIINAGTFTRWLKAATIAGGSVNGLFPMGTLANNRLFYVSAPATAPTTGGTMSVAYNDVGGRTAVSFADGASTVAVEDNLNWAVTTGNGLAGGTYNLDIQGTGYGTIGAITDLRLVLAGSAIGVAGVNAGTTADPQVNTTGLSLANLSNSFFLGSVNAVTSPLPVELVSFTASVVDEQVKLAWETASETNNDYFTIERSKDGVLWDSLERVAGSGNGSGNVSGASFYTADDPAPYTGVSYYRLVQTDFGGRQTYSTVDAVNIQAVAGQYNIFPNPAANVLSVSFPVAGQYTVALFNPAGQLMAGRVSGTGTNIVLNVSQVAAGVYFIVIGQGNKAETKSVVIRR